MHRVKLVSNTGLILRRYVDPSLYACTYAQNTGLILRGMWSLYACTE